MLDSWNHNQIRTTLENIRSYNEACKKAELITFNFNGQQIVDPTTTENGEYFKSLSGLIEYYGEDNISKILQEYAEKVYYKIGGW